MASPLVCPIGASACSGTPGKFAVRVIIVYILQASSRPYILSSVNLSNWKGKHSFHFMKQEINNNDNFTMNPFSLFLE